MQIIDSDIEASQSLVIADFIDFANKVIYFVVVSIIVIKLHFSLIFLIVFVIPLLIYISKVMIPKIQKCRAELIEHNEYVRNSTNQIYSGSLSIKLANAYSFIKKKIDVAITLLQKKQIKFVKLSIIHTQLFTANLLNLTNLVVVILGSYLVIKGKITAGSITVLLAYFSGLWGTYNFFISFWKNYQVKMISIDRIKIFLELPVEQSDGFVVDEFSNLQLCNISYIVDNNSILSNASLNINRSEQILITGDNGSGKSTLVRLLVGLMSPSSGKIEYNGKEIGEYNLYSLRDRICYIPAEPYIFSGGLDDNFFGKQNVSKLVDPEKYNNIASDGINLSSGEKKKLQLAVGMQQKSDIYILDEPLNFVDEISKKEIVETIKRDFKDKTLIIISHDSTHFDFCHCKYVMQNGSLRKL